MKAYVQDKSVKSYTDGEFAGAFRDLIAKNPGYTSIRRGYYVYIPVPARQIIANTDYSLAKDYGDILKKTVLDLHERSNNIDVLNLSDKDLLAVQEVKNIINFLKSSTYKTV